MHLSANVNTPFHIDLSWWQANERDLGVFLAEMLGDDSERVVGTEPLDYIDPETAEVQTLDSLWVRVLMHRAGRPDFIATTTPMTNAVLRALIENRNRPMTPVDLHRRINRTSPETILRLMRTAQVHYGIVPADATRSTPKRGK